MADYNSSYTGVQIDNAVGKMYETIAEDSNGSYYALGIKSNGSLMNVSRKGCMFNAGGSFSCTTLSSGNINCNDIDCHQIFTSATMVLGQSNGGTMEGGELQFADSSSAVVGFIDAYRTGSSVAWNLRVCKPGQEHLKMNLQYGNITIHNTSNSWAWIRCADNATIWSDVSARTGGGAMGHLGMKTPSGRWALITYNTERLYFTYCTDANVNADNNVATANIQFDANGKIYGSGGWGDYAELRTGIESKPGLCVHENGDGSLTITSERLMRGSHIISDTYGMLIGQEGDNQIAVGVSGRVLAYIYEGREEASKHIGWPVCSGPNGTVSIMTEEEEQKYPSRIIGTISEIPTYEEWGNDKIKINGRIWIHIK